MKPEEKNKSRRDFLNKGAITAAVTAVGGGIFYALKKSQNAGSG